MGQCYEVNAIIKFKDNNTAGFCKKIKSHLLEKINNMRRPERYLKTDWDDPKECMKALASNEDGYVQIYENNKENLFEYDSAFDASYSWEQLLCETLEDAAKELEKSSEFRIIVDMSTEHRIIVKRNKINYTYKES